MVTVVAVQAVRHSAHDSRPSAARFAQRSAGLSLPFLLRTPGGRPDAL